MLALLAVAALIALSFFLLEHFKKSTPPAPPVTATQQSEQAPHLKLPTRPAPQPQLSSAVEPPAAKPKASTALLGKGPGKVAIIVDDMGTNTRELEALLSIRLPLTFAVIPSLAQAKSVSEGAHRAGAEVIVHMPMEPEGYPKQKLEKIGLLVNMEKGEIQERVNSFFRTVPHAVGANNHMGSRFTQNAEKMDAVLQVLKGKGLFFVDSKTSPASVGYQRAKALGLTCGVRQVFLDNVQDEAAIGKQLAQAAAIARKKGQAIAICHPHPATIRALQNMMPQLAANGITFVPASALVKL